MGFLKGAMRAGIAIKALDLAKRELRKPENQRKLKSLASRAQAEVRKPANQQKAKDMLGKVSRRGRKAGPGSPNDVAVPPS